MKDKQIRDLYNKIRNYYDQIDFLDDLIAKYDLIIYKIKKGEHFSPKIVKKHTFRSSNTYLNTKINLDKYFLTEFDIQTKSKNFNSKITKIVRDLEFEIEKRKDLLKIRESDINYLSQKSQSCNQQINNNLGLQNTLAFSRVKNILKYQGKRELINKILHKGQQEIKKIFSPKKAEQNLIAYIVNALAISGGMQIVIRHVNELQKRGYNVCIISMADYDSSSWLKVNCPVYYIRNCSQEFLEGISIMIGTHWSTAPYVSLSKAKRKIYFVQSDERRFILEKKYNKNLISYITETYKADMEFMTEAIWIQRWLKDEFNKDAYYVPNGLDQQIFFKDKPILKKSVKKRVLIEGQINFWLKGVEEAYEAVRGLDCEIWIVSSWGKPPKHWKYDKFFEKVPFEKMRNIYSACDIFIKMSKVEGFFGPPMEAMTCGCAVVVGKVSGYDEYIKHRYNALVVEKGDVQKAREYVNLLINDDILRNKLIENGLKVANNWSWDRSIGFLEKMIKGEKIEKFYTSNFPEKYSFKKEQADLAKYLKARTKYLYS